MRSVQPSSVRSLPASRRHQWARSGILAILFLHAGMATPASLAEADASEIARQTVAGALGTDPTTVRIVTIRPRDFPDASLDCPAPGMAYAQVITPGYQVLAEAAGRRFDVRVAGTRGRICRKRQPATGEAQDDGPPPRQAAEAARQDFARRLGLPLDAVTVTDLRRLKPGETLPGCGEVCASGTEPGGCGVGVRLRAGTQEHDYVALPVGVRPCPDIAAR